jgi:hypothetical protein
MKAIETAKEIGAYVSIVVGSVILLVSLVGPSNLTAIVLKDLILASCAIVGAVVALRGLSTWRHQAKWQVEYNAARQLLRSVYQLREAIESVRAPFMSTGEMTLPPGTAQENMTREREHYLRVSNAYDARWERIRSARTEVSTNLLEAEVLWGREIRAAFMDLFNLVQDLSFAISDYLETINPDVRTELSTEERARIRGIMYYGHRGDSYWPSVVTVIEQIENVLRPHLAD